MSDEDKTEPLFICPCCKLNFQPKDKYIAHLKKMLALLIAAAKNEGVAL